MELNHSSFDYCFLNCSYSGHNETSVGPVSWRIRCLNFSHYTTIRSLIWDCDIVSSSKSLLYFVVDRDDINHSIA
jgi:hypothetical protein